MPEGRTDEISRAKVIRKVPKRSGDSRKGDKEGYSSPNRRGGGEDVERGDNFLIDVDDEALEETSPFSVTLCASIYNIFVLSGICSIIVAVGIYILSFFYFALQFECTNFIYDPIIGHAFNLRRYLIVTGSILIVIFVSKLYSSFFLKLVTNDKDVLKTATVPYYCAVIVFDIYLILGSFVFWKHQDHAREICDNRTHKYLHDVIIVNYLTAAYLNNVLYLLFIGSIKVYDYSLDIFAGSSDDF